jgi:hypothetical protein
MKKWISCLLCGMLVICSVLAAGTSLNEEKIVKTAPRTLEQEYVPVMFEIHLNVDSDGTYAVELADQHYEISNWTNTEHHEVIVREIISNPYNNTGSTNCYWRIAEFQLEGIWGWLLFWLMHGRVKPTESQNDFLGMTIEKIEWGAADPEVKVIDTIIGIEIDPTQEFEIDMWLNHGIFGRDILGIHDWSSIKYSPMTP